MDRILKERKVKFDEIPEGFDIESLPEDIEIILEDSFWEDED